MGKGKKARDIRKKKDESKGEELPAIGSLSLEESQPSTSAEAVSTSAPQPSAEAAATPTPPIPAPIPATPAPAPAKPDPADDDDEGGLGLGLGKSKKRPKKKKPKDAGGDQSKETTPAPQSRASSQAPVPTEPPARGVPTAASESVFPSGAPPGFAGPQGFPTRAGPAMPHPTPAATAAQYPGFASAPEPAPPGFPAWQAPSAGRGQGRGRGGGSAPSAGPSPPGPTQQRPAPAYVAPGPGQQRSAPASAPSMSGQQKPAPAYVPPNQRSAPAAAPPPLRAQATGTVSRFKIPDKIIGNRVRSIPIQVLVNYLPMTIKNLKINRYDVSFKPDKPKKMIPKVFIVVKNKYFPKHLIAFDQMKNCYSLSPLPNVTDERFSTAVEIIDNNGKTMKFEVSFKSTGTVDLSTISNYMRDKGSSLNPPTEAIQCIDVVLRQGTLENYVKAGRQFFKRPANPIDLGDGLEMWTGLFQSAIFTNQAFINVDVAHKGFPRRQPLIDAMTKDFRLKLNQPLDTQPPRSVDLFQSFIKGLRVMASIGGDCSSKGQRREFICNEVVDPPHKIFFPMHDQKTGKDRKMSVAEYFMKEKKIRLRYPELNCMWVGPREKNIYYPIELLEVVEGQALNKQLNETQLATMVRTAATPPNERKAKIEDVIRDIRTWSSTFDYILLDGVSSFNRY